MTPPSPPSSWSSTHHQCNLGSGRPSLCQVKGSFPGFVVINLARRMCFHVNTSQHVERCRLRSAVHYLRNYRDDTIGMILSADVSEQQQVAIIQCANGPWALSDKVRFHTARAILDRLLRLVITKYDHVTFWRGKSE